MKLQSVDWVVQQWRPNNLLTNHQENLCQHFLTSKINYKIENWRKVLIYVVSLSKCHFKLFGSQNLVSKYNFCVKHKGLLAILHGLPQIKARFIDLANVCINIQARRRWEKSKTLNYENQIWVKKVKVEIDLVDGIQRHYYQTLIVYLRKIDWLPLTNEIQVKCRDFSRVKMKLIRIFTWKVPRFFFDILQS